MRDQINPETQPGAALEDEEFSYAFSLLGAVPFHISNSKNLVWPQRKLAKDFLHVASDILPNTVEAWESMIEGSGRKERSQALQGLTWNGAQYKTQYQITTLDARKIWVEERGVRTEGTDKTPAVIKGVINNIDAVKEAQERAAYLARHDDLTGLWNLSRFHEGLDYAVALGKRNQSLAFCLQVNVSNLSEIFEAYGYETGEQLIKLAAGRLRDMMTPPDLLARIGDRSFGLAVFETSANELDSLAETIKTVLSGKPYQTRHGNLSLKIDIGATQLGVDTSSAQAVLSQTRTALTHNPLGGLTFYTPDMEQAETKAPAPRIDEDDILQALNDRRISLAYQPIVDAKSRELHHYECLLRLRTQSGELISAWRFIVEAEKLGLVDLLDRRALELARDTLRQHPEVHLALNVSAGTVKNKDIADDYIAALRALGPDVNRVTLELTETLALEDPAMASRFSDEARSLGCEFAIDDFGAGYTTFRNLLAIEADTIKIDGKFIQNLSSSPNNQTFVRMMVDLAQTFGVKTVAEMVDNPADADLLERLGVDYLQGYMFGIPSAAPAWGEESS